MTAGLPNFLSDTQAAVKITAEQTQISALWVLVQVGGGGERPCPHPQQGQ